MQNVRFTRLDAIDGIPANLKPVMMGGAVEPPGIRFLFDLESRWPVRPEQGEYVESFGKTDRPTRDGAGMLLPGILEDGITDVALAEVHQAELTARAARVRAALTPRIDAEHDRRALLGRAFPVEGVGDVPLEGSEKTQVVLLALKDTARDLRDAGVTAPLLMLTDRDGTDRRLNADQMIALVNAGKAWMQQVHEAKRALKAMDPIPADFADDRHWPPLA